MKKCSKCKEMKDETEFWRRSDGRDGLRNQCKLCISTSNKIRYHKLRGIEPKEPHTTHPLYVTYKNMLRRCYSKKCKMYKYYGGRGILVCGRWLGRLGFLNFIKDIPPKPSPEYTLDRINNDFDYDPDNVRWATRKEQANNRRKRKKSKH